MNIGFFTYITGIATLLGLFIQIKDVFPQHRETRKNVIFIILGLFIGTLFGSFQRVNVNLAVPMSGIYFLVGSIIIVLFVLLISAVFTSDNEKRMQLFAVTGYGGFLLFVILLGYLFLQSPRLKPMSVNSLTKDELLFLSDINREKENFERSIYFLTRVKEDLDNADPRHDTLEKKISELKKLQIGQSR